MGLCPFRPWLPRSGTGVMMPRPRPVVHGCGVPAMLRCYRSDAAWQSQVSDDIVGPTALFCPNRPNRSAQTARHPPGRAKRPSRTGRQTARFASQTCQPMNCLTFSSAMLAVKQQVTLCAVAATHAQGVITEKLFLWADCAAWGRKAPDVHICTCTAGLRRRD